MTKLEVIEGIEQYASQSIGAFLTTFESTCPELYSLAADHLMARLLHTVVIVKDPDLTDKATPEAIHALVGELQGRLPALVAKIVDDYNKTENGSASH